MKHDDLGDSHDFTFNGLETFTYTAAPGMQQRHYPGLLSASSLWYLWVEYPIFAQMALLVVKISFAAPSSRQ